MYRLSQFVNQTMVHQTKFASYADAIHTLSEHINYYQQTNPNVKITYMHNAIDEVANVIMHFDNQTTVLYTIKPTTTKP